MKKLGFLLVLLVAGHVNVLPSLSATNDLPLVPADIPGTLLFQNRVISSNVVDAPVSYAPGTSKGGESGRRINGFAEGVTARAGLFAGPDGATEDQLVLLAPAVGFRSAAASGYVNVGSQAARTLNVEGAFVPAGGYAMVQVRAWDTGNTNDTWQQASANPAAYKGKSNLLRIQTGAGEPPPQPALLVGLQPFSIAPEQGPPLVVNSIPNQTNLAGAFWSYQLPTNAFTTLNPGQVLAYGSPSLPPGISFNADTRTFSGILSASGIYNIQVVATDNSTPPVSATNRFLLIITNPVFALSVNRAGSGSGVVMSSSTNIVCSNACSVSLPGGSTLTLIAISLPGSDFAGWGGACNGTGACTLSMNENRSVTARFVSTVLEVHVVGDGSVSRAPDKPYYRLGDMVTLTAFPPRWHGVRWNDGLTTNPRTITIGESNQYTAAFYPTTALETVTFDGVTRVGPVGMPAIFVNGRFVTEPTFTNRGPGEITIVSSFQAGSIQYSLNDTDPVENGAAYAGPFKVKKDAVIRAVAFNSDTSDAVAGDPLSLKILPTVFASTPGGGTIHVVLPGGGFESNQSAVVTATPAEGWQFLEWRGDAEGQDPAIMVSLDRDRCVEAIFGTSINIRTEGDGSVNQSPLSGVLPYGTPVRLTPVPEPGRYFAEWSGTAGGNADPLTMVITNATPTLSAHFAPLGVNEDTLTVLIDGGGSVLVDPMAATFRSNMRAALTAIPLTGQSFLGWSGDASKRDTNNTILLKMNKSRIVTAHFTRYPKLVLEPCQEGCGQGFLRTIISGPADTQYRVERSTNLVDWTAVGTVTNLYGTVQVRDPLQTTSGEQRYYRAIVLP